MDGRVASRSIADLRADAARCTDCDLYEHATQTVFGEGPPTAELVMIGEQPGDREDRDGHPFIGPAGQVLDDALEAAGLDRERVYVTNAVKHFKWTARGKVRLHKPPNAAEVAACRQWWQQELEAIRPAGVVCLGATATGAVLGRDVRVMRDRGRFFDHPRADWVMVTVHPSSILRASDRDARFAEFVDDLVVARRRLADGVRGVSLPAESGIAPPEAEQLRIGIEEAPTMPTKSANVKNEKQYEALKDKGMSKERAAKIANSPKASKHGGEKSHSGSGKKNQGGTTAQHKAAGRKGGKATAKKR